MADNDLAMGKVVEAVTHSQFGSNTVILVVEDDPSERLDHVDGHRSLCLVISPYTRRKEVVSVFYNQAGLMHTMEQILGLPPMNQEDAMAPLMFECFTNVPDFTAYTALPNNVPLEQMNPGTNGALKRKERYWARLSESQDLSRPDRINDNIFNRVVWHAVKGEQPYPAKFAGAHGRGLKPLHLALAKGVDKDE